MPEWTLWITTHSRVLDEWDEVLAPADDPGENGGEKGRNMATEEDETSRARQRRCRRRKLNK